MAFAGHAPALLILCALVRAQAPLKEVSIRTRPYTPASAILRADTNLVETGLIVRDARGHTVGGLHASDLEVLDNGVPQQISAFSELRAEISRPNAAQAGANPSEPAPSPAPSAEPKFVTFFFDDLHVANGSMLFVKKGARAFIAHGIGPSDHLSIVTASGQGDLDFTTDAKRFAEALEHVAAHERPVVTGYCGVNPIDSYIFLHNMDGQIVDEAIAAAINCGPCSAGDSPGQCRAARDLRR